MTLSNHIEALLFLSGQPLSVKKLEQILGKKEKELNEAINELENNLSGRGLRLLKNGGEIMIGTAPESSKYCQILAKEELDKNLGKAGLETLAIILYNDGISKANIDYTRGVNSGFTLRSLLIKGLVERKVNPKDRRTHFYTSSVNLFQVLGITKKEELPDFDNFKKEIENAVEFS
ncbi:SMC-Scp complex subunit ScpB [Patescibacteria group bacterium]|nr:SMC-Scp complex subunit ScpB [Patescibacteria group bacterium]